MRISDELRKRLDGLPLGEVMTRNGYSPERTIEGGRAALYHALHRRDNDASLEVDLASNDKLKGRMGFYDHGRTEVKGVGAVQLQAYIDQLSPKDDFVRVCRRLGQLFNIEVATSQEEMAGRTRALDYERGADFADISDVAAWTPTLLRAIGCEVVQVQDAEDDTPHYKYSWGKDFYRRDCPADNFDPQTVSDIFHCYPLATFVTPNIPNQQKGGKFRLELTGSEDYPMFVFTHDNGDGTGLAKKYEPMSRPHKGKDDRRADSKWTWWKIRTEQPESTGKGRGEATAPPPISRIIFGDKDVEHALRTGEVVASDPDGHPLIEIPAEQEGAEPTRKFRRLVLCSGPRDALNVYFHSDAHVAYLYNENGTLAAGGLRRLQDIAQEVYILYDTDDAGLQAMHKMAFAMPTVKVVYLPEAMSGVTDGRSGKACKDVSEYFANWRQIVRGMDSYWHDADVNEHFAALLRTARPMQWWVEVYGTTGKKGGGRKAIEKYRLSVKNMTQFLSASGMLRGTDETGRTDFIEMQGNLYQAVSPDGVDDEIVERARQYMTQYLRRYSDYYTETLEDAVYTAKGLSTNTLMALSKIQLNTLSWGEDFDYVLFRDRALRVTADKLETVNYKDIPFHINRQRVLKSKFKQIELPFRIIPNPDMKRRQAEHEARLAECKNDDQRNAENRKWLAEATLWPYTLELTKPYDEMPILFRFLYNTGRFYHRKEARGLKLSRTEKQMQDMSFIVKMFCLGYMIACYRDSTHQQMVLCTDYSQADQSKSTGGNGKSIFGKLLQLVRHGLPVAGQSFRTQTEAGKNFAKYRPLIDSYVFIDDLSDRVRGEDFYNIVERLVVKRLYHDEEQLDPRISPKLIVTSNLFFDLSAQSTFRRVRTALFSDYYHAANHEDATGEFSPKIEFGKDIIAKATPEEMDEMLNILVYALQLYLRHQEVPLTPTDKRFQMRAAARAIKDDALINWAADFFAPERTWRFGRPVLASDIYLSYLRHTGQEFTAKNYNAAVAKMRRALPAICDILDIRMDPNVVFVSASAEERGGERRAAWGCVTDADNIPVHPMRRDIIKGRTVHYFYHIEADPNNPDDHIPDNADGILGPTETDMEDMI